MSARCKHCHMLINIRELTEMDGFCSYCNALRRGNKVIEEEEKPENFIEYMSNFEINKEITDIEEARNYLLERFTELKFMMAIKYLWRDEDVVVYRCKHFNDNPSTKMCLSRYLFGPNKACQRCNHIEPHIITLANCYRNDYTKGDDIRSFVINICPECVFESDKKCLAGKIINVAQICKKYYDLHGDALFRLHDEIAEDGFGSVYTLNSNILEGYLDCEEQNNNISKQTQAYSIYTQTITKPTLSFYKRH